MTDQDITAFTEIMYAAADIYGKQINERTIGLWFSTIGPSMTISEFDAAIKKHMADPKVGQFFPKPADIVRNMSSGMSPKEISNEQQRQTWLAKKKREFATGQAAYEKADIEQAEVA